MSDDEAFCSDSSDGDYEPLEGEAVSEEEGSGEEEDLAVLGKSEGEDTDSKDKKKCKKKNELGRGKRKGGIQLDDEVDHSEEKTEQIDFNAEEKKAKELEYQEKEKKKSDNLWASFLSDVGGPPPKAKTSSGMGSFSSVKKPTTKAYSSPTTTTQSPSTSSKSSKIMITKEYDFAGETVKVTKEVDANSAEAKTQQKSEEHMDEEAKSVETPVAGVKRAGGGLGSLVGRLSKAPKISTLDKSKLDWQNFKQDNKLAEELSTHNKGKEGYLERKAFLERTDLRQFEIEKSIRLSNVKR